MRSACIESIPTAAATGTAGPTGTPQACNGCYVVADVAGVVFGEDIRIQTQTAIEFQGPNSTFRRTLTQGFDQVSLVPSGVLGDGFTSFDTGPTITVAGAVLYDPVYDEILEYSPDSLLVSPPPPTTCFPHTLLHPPY